MYNYKEIVTKAVIGKGKKVFKNDYQIKIDKKADTVLGCWVINHNMKGIKLNDSIKILGSFDVNIWYSYDNNTKTDVVSKKIFYDELVKVKIKENSDLTEKSDIIVRSLSGPSCIDVSSDSDIIKYTISKELGIEVVGDTKVKIAVQSNNDDYDLIEDDSEIEKEIDDEVNEEYIKENNEKSID